MLHAIYLVQAKHHVSCTACRRHSPVKLMRYSWCGWS